MNKIGLIAGNGSLPLLFLNKAREKSFAVYTLAIKNETPRKVIHLSERSLVVPVGQLDKGVRFFTENNVKEAVMLGQVRHFRLLQPKYLDPQMTQLLSQIPDRRTNTFLGAIANHFQEKGISFLSSSFLIEELFLPAGTTVGPNLSQREKADVELGRKVAETLAGLDVGLTVAVKDGIVLALEGISGTDSTIRRAGRFTKGLVVVKVSRPKQDLRFDLPVIGPRTLKVMARISGRVLAISSGTFVLEKEEVFCLSRRYGITLTVF
ncbi:MAG: UDP-2,3-diacylglucosamine diphosphatase LpxI [Candidatus Omnitrophota bacterium]